MPAVIVSRSGPAPRRPGKPRSGSGGRGGGGGGGGGDPVRVALVVVAMVIAAALMVAAALWFRGRGDDGGGGERAEPGVTTTTGDEAAPSEPEAELFPAGPTELQDGIPVGFERSEPGAVAAVMSWSPYYGRTEDPQVAFELLDTVWMEETFEVEREAEELARGRQLGDYNERGTLDNLAAQGVALAWRVEDYSDEEAVVSVWDVALVAQEPVEGPTVLFRTVRWTLRWDDDASDWRVYTTATDTGPTPALGYADRDDLLRTTPRLEGFTYWDPLAEEGAGEWPVVLVPDGDDDEAEAPPDEDDDGG